MERAVNRSRRAGFTLIEAIAAMVILSVALPPMLWAIRDAQVRRVGPIMASRARFLATEKLEEVIADRHSATRGYAWVATARYADEASVAGFPGFARAVAVAETDASLVGAGTGYKTVTVTISWTDVGGIPRSLVVSTVITDYTA
jgi:prepilin-type N-terminal cleavage/methylation domain-containing protein